MMWIPNILIAMFFMFSGYLVFFTAEGLIQEPRFNFLTRNVTVVAGQRAILPCSVDYLGSYKVVWQSPRGKTLTLEERRIISDDRVSLERPYVKEWNLHIHNVKTLDAGTYQCQINTDPVQIREVMLHVNESPKIIESLSSGDIVTVREGDLVELVCNVTGLPPPTVIWFRINTGLLEDEDGQARKRIGMEGEVLVIHNVSRYCDDKYACVADNGVPPPDTREIRVHVEFPPEVRLPNKKIGQVRGKSTILECEITAYPQILTVWRRNGNDIIRNTKYTTEMYNEGGNKVTLILKIQSLEEDDYGEYECYALNLLGNDVESMLLYEYHKPEEKTTTTTAVMRPLSQNTDDRRGNNRYNNNGDQQQWNPHSEHVDYSQSIDGQRKAGKYKPSTADRSKSGEYSSQKGFIDSEKASESEAESKFAIFNSEEGHRRNSAQNWTYSDKSFIVLLLLVHKVCSR